MEEVTMQIRQHRGGLDESVATMKTIPATLEAMREYLKEFGEKGIPFTEEQLASVRVMPYLETIETRIPGWEGPTFLVVFRPSARAGFQPLGMCSKAVVEKENKSVSLDPELAKMVAELTPKAPTQQPAPERTLEKAQEYIRQMLKNMINSGLAGTVMEHSIKIILAHPSFERWWKTSIEDRPGLPQEVQDDLDEIDRRIADARFVFDTVMPMIADPKGFLGNLEIMRRKGINIRNEAGEHLGVTSKYYLGVRGEWGWLHLYNGN